MKVLLLIALLVSCCPIRELPKPSRVEYLKVQDTDGNQYLLIVPPWGPIEITKIK